MRLGKSPRFKAKGSIQFALDLDAVRETGLPVHGGVHGIVRLDDEVTLVTGGTFGIARIGLAGAEAAAMGIGFIAGGEAALAGIDLTGIGVGRVLAETGEKALALTLADIDDAEGDREGLRHAGIAEVGSARDVLLREDGGPRLGGGEALALQEVVTGIADLLQFVLLAHVSFFTYVHDDEPLNLGPGLDGCCFLRKRYLLRKN
jgi:hypothetical protein